MPTFRKPVFLTDDSYRRYIKALDRRKSPLAGHYPVGDAILSEGAKRALRRRFPNAPELAEPGEPSEHDDAFVFDTRAPR